MAHIRYDGGIERVTHSDDGWYDVASQVGARARARSGRGDITGVISQTWPYGGQGAPACWVPSLGEVFLDRSIVPLGDPAKVDMTDRLWRLEHAAAVGALEHEASHARHTKSTGVVDWKEEFGASRRMIDVIVALEEPRIEYNAIRADSETRPFLRACALEIVMKDFHIADTPYGASIAAALLLCRVDAGVISKAEAAPFRRDIRKVLGAETIEKLEPLWRRFLKLYDKDFAAMVEIARAWLEALEMDPDDEDDAEQDLASGSLFGEGEPGEGGDGEDSEGEGEGDLSERISERGRSLSTKVDGEIAESRGAERKARRMAERKADAERSKDSEDPHEEAFPSHGWSAGGDAHFTGLRAPTADERAAARTLAKTLEKLDYHDRVVVRTTREVPPGRLRSGKAVAEAAARTHGLDFTEDVWKGKRRVNVESTPLTVGLLADISGSMNAAMPHMSSTQWVLSTAGAHIDAKVATVHFGEKVHGVLPAGCREKGVRNFHAGDGFEAFKFGSLALDRELNLLNGTGARLMIVLSDGHFVDPTHAAYARKFVPLAISKGVAVLWLHWDGLLTSYGATAVNIKDLRPSQVATLVGQAATQEIRRLDAGR